MLPRSIVPLAVALLGVACGSAQSAARSGPPPAHVIRAVASAPVLPTPRAGTPAPSAPPPQAAPVPATFTGVVVHAPGARVRFGPGLDMPVMDIDPAGRAETFDGWFRRVDDQPQTDDITGRIEPWSRDWLRLSDGRGWIHSAAVRGHQPDGMAQSAWSRPVALPAARAGLVEVALHAQEHPVTCEVASLRMALASRGIATDEEALLQLTGVDRRPAVASGSGVVRWGDPNQAFVGDPDGHISAHTGYGVYAGPIASAARLSGASVMASGTGIAPSTVYAALVAGHPVEVWVPNDLQPATVRTWQAWDGATIPYTMNEHAILVIGVTADSILVNDPLGSQRWIAKATFEAAYATFDEMAVIVA